MCKDQVVHAEESRGTQFESAVADHFRRSGAKVEQHVLIRGMQVDLFVGERLASGVPVRTVVEIKSQERPVSVEQTARFVFLASDLRAAGEADMFVLVSPKGFSARSRAMAGDAGVHLFVLSDLESREASEIVASSEVSAPRRQSSPLTRKTVFVSYCHSDRRFLARLRVHLRPLERDGLINLWSDEDLRAGDDWRSEIALAISSARVAIMLVSADFLASDFIAVNEVPQLLARAKSEGARIMPVVLQACGFVRHKGLAVFQAVNDPGRPLAELNVADRERVWDSLAREVIESVRS